jgi:uncharacterized membrane protein
MVDSPLQRRSDLFTLLCIIVVGYVLHCHLKLYMSCMCALAALMVRRLESLVGYAASRRV